LLIDVYQFIEKCGLCQPRATFGKSGVGKKTSAPAKLGRLFILKRLSG